MGGLIGECLEEVSNSNMVGQVVEEGDTDAGVVIWPIL